MFDRDGICRALLEHILSVPVYAFPDCLFLLALRLLSAVKEGEEKGKAETGYVSSVG